MKMMIDYRKDLKKSFRLMRGKTSSACSESFRDEFVGSALRKLNIRAPDAFEKAKNYISQLLFCLDNVARINGGKIEVDYDEKERIVKILCSCDGYYVISKERDLTRDCFFRLCDYADSFFITNKDKKIEIDAAVKI